MSKSLGNFFSVRELLDQGYPGEVIRFVFLSTHYSKPMDWTDKKAQEAEATLRKIANLLGGDPLSKPGPSKAFMKPPQEFVEALANDLNTSLAITLIKKYLKKGQELELEASLKLLGFNPGNLTDKFCSFQLSSTKNEFTEGTSLQSRGSMLNFDKAMLTDLGNRLRLFREKAMETKDFSEVDELKAALINAGVEVQMSKEGVFLKPAAGFDPSKLEALK